jgi:hypothetical protein
MSGFTLDRWFSIANKVYILAVLIAAAASFAIYQLSNRLSERDQAEKDVAKKEVAIAKSDAAKASQRSLELQVQLEAEQLERLKLQEKLSSRHLSEEQAAKLAGAVRWRQIDGIVVTRLGDYEANGYASDIIQAFQKGKSNVEIMDTGTLSPPVYGLVVNDFAENGNVITAFEEAGIPFIKGRPTGAIPHIIVGLKPPNL